jgi:hypothetical protein
VATSTITGTITDATGVAVASVPVTCRLMPVGGFRSADGSEVARLVSTTGNASGVYSFVLERNSGITPANSYYEIVEYIPAANGGTKVWNISVGASNQTVLAALVTPLAAQTATYLTQASADARYQALGSISSATPTASRFGDSGAAGSSTAASRDDHKHSREALPQTAAVATSETTASASYTDLATVGPAVTVTTGTSALVTVYCLAGNNTGGQACFMGFAVSGATTVAAADAFSVEYFSSVGNNNSRICATFLVTGLTAGSNVFTAKYKASANTATFLDRKITVVPVS